MHINLNIEISEDKAAAVLAALTAALGGEAVAAKEASNSKPRARKAAAPPKPEKPAEGETRTEPQQSSEPAELEPATKKDVSDAVTALAKVNRAAAVDILASFKPEGHPEGELVGVRHIDPSNYPALHAKLVEALKENE